MQPNPCPVAQFPLIALDASDSYSGLNESRHCPFHVIYPLSSSPNWEFVWGIKGMS